ncbi:MAG TPA: O-antigen ligase family protein [Gaiellaceae bacterium]
MRAAFAAAPVPILLTTLYFTFSRGSWIALGIGLVVALTLDPHRVRLTATALTVGVPAGLGVLAASRSVPLTHLQSTVARAAHDGHRLALLLLAFVVACAALTAALVLLRSVMSIPPVVSRSYPIALLAAAAVAVAVVLVYVGGPSAAARRAWDSFAAAPPKTQLDLRKRLFSFSGTGRADLFRAAWYDAQGHLIVGSGAGSYEAYWLSHRTVATKVRDAHSLYLETLAEGGIVGLALLLLALGTPLVAAARARKRRGVAAATGAYVAYLAGAAVDWDWEITSVTLAAIFVGVALLASARSDDERETSPVLRYSALGVALAIGVVGFVFLVGNMFLSRASTAAADAKWATAARDAHRASSWLPWSTQPWEQLGEAELAQGHVASAQASFRTAIEKDDGDWNLWLDLARASTGKPQLAALAHATKLNPLSPEIAAFRSDLGSQLGISITASGAKP